MYKMHLAIIKMPFLIIAGFCNFDSTRSRVKTKEIGWLEGRFELEKQMKEDEKKQEISLKPKQKLKNDLQIFNI